MFLLKEKEKCSNKTAPSSNFNLNESASNIVKYFHERDVGSELEPFSNALKLEIKGIKVLILLYKKFSNPVEFCGIYLG